jgi:hypothetical protein
MVDLGPLHLTPEGHTMLLRANLQRRRARAQRRREILTGLAFLFLAAALGWFLFVLRRS